MSAVGARDGMALELTAENGERVAEVFEDDATRARTVTFFTDQPVALKVVEWFLSRAADEL